jgi:uncharacterized protein with FMN-binding domain
LVEGIFAPSPDAPGLIPAVSPSGYDADEDCRALEFRVVLIYRYIRIFVLFRRPRVKGRALSLVIVAISAAALLSASPIARVYVDGVYSLDYTDDELGSVSVRATVKDGGIAAIELPKGKGDIQLDDASLSAYIAALLAASDYRDVDAISGATQSCDLLKYALLNALKAAKAR